MKHFILSLLIGSFLFCCSEKPIETTRTEIDSSISPAKDSLISHQTNIAFDNSSYHMYEQLNKDNTSTIVTFDTPLYYDSLLQQASDIHLEVGQTITILSYAGAVPKGNWNEPVYKVSVELEGNKEYGYVPQSKIACFHKTLTDSKNVYLTLNYNHPKNYFICFLTLKTNDGMLLATKAIELNIMYKEGTSPYSFYYSFDFYEREHTGLEGVMNAFHIIAGYPACGYPYIENLFLWNGTTLLNGPETYSVSDAGSLYVTNTLYLPSDSLGKTGYITQITEIDESIQNSDSEFKKDSIVVLYKWNNARGLGKADTILTTSSTCITKQEEF